MNYKLLQVYLLFAHLLVCCSYEKLISGMYMGEIARRIIVQCISLGCLFNGQLSDELNTPHRFYTKYVSEIEKYCSFSTSPLLSILAPCGPIPLSG